MKRINILVLVFCTCFALAAEHHARPQWRNKIVVFDAPDAGTNGSYGQGTYGNGINDWWAITGFYIDSNNVYHSYVRDPWGNITEFDPPHAGKNGNYYQGSFALSINNWGVITGGYEDSNNVYHGFVRYPWGTITEFDTPDAGKIGDCQCQGTVPVSINDAGAVTGYYTDSNSVNHGFVRDPYGTISEWDPPDAGKEAGQGTLMFTLGHHINPEGSITGQYIDGNNVWHGFLRHPDGTFTEFEPRGGGKGPGPVTYAHTVAPDGWINGTYQDLNYTYHAYVRRPDGTFIEFKILGAGTGTGQGAGAHDGNPQQVITGPFIDVNSVWHGYVWTPYGELTKFDAPGAGTGSGQGTSPSSINSAGAITGNSSDAANVTHGFLRLPD